MIYKRYGGSAADILAMPFFEGTELIEFALDEEAEEKLFERWIAGYQSQMSYEEFKRSVGVSRTEKRDNRSAGEILQSVREIIG